jgi:type II secretory pathway pseudopilin PulG
MINKARQQKNKGFTLIEVLVAVFILITAVVVPLTIGSKAYAYSNFVRDQSTASYLAQEAVEFVRLTRDNASLNPSPSGAWVDFKSNVNNCMSDDGCQFDVLASSFSINGCPGKCDLLYLQADGTYTYTPVSGSNKWFLRTVKTSLVGKDALERVRVEVTVLWNTNSIDERSFTVIDYLTPWQL